MHGRHHRGVGIGGAAAVLAALLVTGCERPNQSATTVHDTVVQNYEHNRPAAASQPAEAANGAARAGRPIAFVNDVPIERAMFIQLLMEGRGLSLLQQLFLREAARQETQRLGLTVTAEDIDHEYDLTLQAAQYDGKDVEKLTPARREQLIDDWTRTRGVTRPELGIAMARQAHLRKIAEKGVKIDDAMLQNEFKRVHGEKVEVRHIQLASPRAWEDLKRRLDAGENFMLLVHDFSQNALSRDKNGLLPPFTADDPTVPAELAKAAFALEPGQVSNPVEAEGSLHVLKLERRIPADDVTFDQVKEELKYNLTARLVAQEMERLGGELLMRARLRIEDQMLREQYKKQYVAGEIFGPALSGQ
ncbi:MAG TPA: peptidyl-prolyl cis-trans isomerase [Phycisphaerae bacterium]|nr:peptidyl-prolyl cis-trans isomerase [Phycisphaerae bacterium]